MTNLLNWLWAPGAREQATPLYLPPSPLCIPSHQCLTGRYQEEPIPLPTYILDQVDTRVQLPPTRHARNYGPPAWQPNQATRALMDQLQKSEEDVVTTPLFKNRR